MTWKLLKKFETQNFSIWIPISKRDITRKPLCPTSHNKCHAHLIFISIMYSNFHVDALTTLEQVLDWKRQRKDNVSPVFVMSPWYLNRVRTFKTLHNRTHNALSNDHYILCIVVCTCYICSSTLHGWFQKAWISISFYGYSDTRREQVYFSEDLMIPETYTYTVVLMIKG